MERHGEVVCELHKKLWQPLLFHYYKKNGPFCVKKEWQVFEYGKKLLPVWSNKILNARLIERIKLCKLSFEAVIISIHQIFVVDISDRLRANMTLESQE